MRYHTLPISICAALICSCTAAQCQAVDKTDYWMQRAETAAESHRMQEAQDCFHHAAQASEKQGTGGVSRANYLHEVADFYSSQGKTEVAEQYEKRADAIRKHL